MYIAQSPIMHLNSLSSPALISISTVCASNNISALLLRACGGGSNLSDVARLTRKCHISCVSQNLDVQSTDLGSFDNIVKLLVLGHQVDFGRSVTRFLHVRRLCEHSVVCERLRFKNVQRRCLC